MSVVSVRARSFILALFIRDDGERFLLGDNGYDFKDNQLHFAANSIENDEVQKQGADGVMVAGQVRRASVQSFDGFVGDATIAKETIEQMRRDFFAFFVKGHHFRVVYVDCNRNAWQRKGGYLVDAPEVKELWQIHPEYHVGLNFEDVNYYSYDEDADGNEILANLVDVPVSTEAEGGLVWDEDGAVSEDAGGISYDEETADATPAKNVYITDATEAPLASFQLDGETSQNGTPTPSAPVAVKTTTGENVVEICGKNLYPFSDTAWSGSSTSAGWVFQDGAEGAFGGDITSRTAYKLTLPAGTYTATAYNISSNVVHIQACANGSPNEIVITNPSNINRGNPTSTITLTETTTFCLRFRVMNPSLGIGNTKIQIEKGSTATAYEPYQGQSYEVNLGKNLFDLTDFTSSISPFTVSGTADNFTITGYSTVYYKLPQDLITFSGSWETTNLNGQIKIYYTDGTNENLLSSYSGSPASGTIAKTTNSSKTPEKLQITTYSTCSLTLKNLQIELGSQATTYAPYFTPIELCKIGDYQDYIYKDGGKWYKHKAVDKMALSSIAGWGRSENGKFFATSFASEYGVVAGDGYSDQFDYSGTAWSADYRFGITGSGNLWVATGDSTLTSTDLFNTWLQNHNPVAYFQLATPADTEITNEALIAQLEALLTTARTYAGTNNITTITPNEQGTLKISYYTKYQPMVGSGGYVWEAGGAGGPTVIINNSIDNVSPVWTIYGPTTNPQLENATTGETIEYVGTIAQGQTLTIDMGEQTASLDGLNVISNLVGDFVHLAPGRNNIIYSVSGEAGASELGWSEIVG